MKQMKAMSSAGAPTPREVRARFRERVGGRRPLEILGFLGPVIAMFWAGIALAGNVIAAGSKFTTGLPRADLLQVGVVQFAWTGYVEWVLVAVWLLAMWPRRRSRIALFFAMPVVLFLIQKLGIHPFLHERTLATIAGEDVGDSPLHIIYGALEGVKIACLVAIGLVGALVHGPRPRTD